MIRVLIVDDHEGWRRQVRQLLRERPGFQVVGEVSDGLEAVEKAKLLKPDLIVLDIGLPKLNGIEVTRQVRQLSPSSKVIILSQENSPDVIDVALSTGAEGYVYKPDIRRRLLPVIEIALVRKDSQADEAQRAWRETANERMDDKDSPRTPIQSQPQDRLETRERPGKAEDPGSTIGSEGHPTTNNPYVLFRTSPWIPKILTSIIEATDANFGDVQLLDSSRQALRIVAHQGFDTDFVTFFETVSTASLCCVQAMKQRSRVIVSDIASDPLLQHTQARDMILRSRIHTCQSTPMIASSGELIGVASTHFDRPRVFSQRVLQRVDEIISKFVAKITSNPRTAG
jgi:DNA-binding NarL/FixJ family response regulator